MRMRHDNEQALASRARRTQDETNAAPKAEFYATIKGPNYDNIWVTHENFGKELDEQRRDLDNWNNNRNFYGMSDEELLMNKHLFEKMGLIKSNS